MAEVEQVNNVGGLEEAEEMDGLQSGDISEDEENEEDDEDEEGEPEIMNFSNPVTNQYNMVLVVEHERFHVSKEHLAKLSEPFHKMFFGEYLERRKEEIPLYDIKACHFQKFLELIYGVPAVLNDGNIEKISILCDRFSVTTGQAQCHHYLMNSSGLSRIEIFDISIRCNMAETTQEAIGSMDPNDLDVINSREQIYNVQTMKLLFGRSMFFSRPQTLTVATALDTTSAQQKAVLKLRQQILQENASIVPRSLQSRSQNQQDILLLLEQIAYRQQQEINHLQLLEQGQEQREQLQQVPLQQQQQQQQQQQPVFLVQQQRPQLRQVHPQQQEQQLAPLQLAQQQLPQLQQVVQQQQQQQQQLLPLQQPPRMQPAGETVQQLVNRLILQLLPRA